VFEGRVATDEFLPTSTCVCRNVRRCMERSRRETLSQDDDGHQHQQQMTSVSDEQRRVVDEHHDDDTANAAATDDAAAAGGDDGDGVYDAGGADAGDAVADAGDGDADDGAGGGEDVSLLDDIECKFNVNSYRMIFVVNTESFLYRRHSLFTARQVSS